METRNMNRRRRMDPPASAPHPPPARGGARPSPQPAISNPAFTPQEAGRRQGLRPASEGSKPMGPAMAAIARRGAPSRDDAASVASMRTVPPRDDESLLAEEERELPTTPEDYHQEEVTRRKIMELTLPDLSHATDELMQRLEHANLEDPVLRRLLQIKLDAFSSVRQSFEEDHTSPLIDWAQGAEIWDDEKFGEAVEVMVRANIATALQVILSLVAGKKLDLLAILEKFNTYFPSLFIVSEDTFQDHELLLDIRTWFLIEALNHVDGKSDVYALIASVFCEPAEDRDYAQRFSAGPFKGLGAAPKVRLEELVALRITNILSTITKNKKTDWISQLKQMFPLEHLLAQLRVWLTDMYAMLGESESQERADQAPKPNEPSQPGGDIEDSQVDGASESQPIVRAVLDEIEPSLFVNQLSVQYVNSKDQNNPLIPPSNQQQIMPPPGAPQDYTEHTNDQLLESPAPANVKEKQLEAPRSARKRIRQPFEYNSEEDDDDDEDDEDVFQTDNRPVDKGKRAAISSSMPKPKRARIVESESHQAPPGSNTSISSSMPPPPKPSQLPNPSQPSQADFETIKLAKKQILSQQSRAQFAPASRQRHVWSHHDCLLLLQLIRDRHAAWSTIERNDGDKFEHPRNQQAYRDKARNMKVDYLITDAILPPCFDFVALGKKEIERLVSLGKNPYRKESDIGVDGQAINTEFTGHLNH